MITLGIETSCDETAVALIETGASDDKATSPVTCRILAESIFSQIDIHAAYGGVFPVMAKREHARRLVPLLSHIISEAKSRATISTESIAPEIISPDVFNKKIETIRSILAEKEPELLTTLLASSLVKEKPLVDRIAVTRGPGLEPALWVGINFARALSVLWDIPVIPTNHMEGHIVGSLLPAKEAATIAKVTSSGSLRPIAFPAIALLISGGHTELVEIPSLGTYHIIGSTRDDAVGEAYDKVARMMNLPYPGGPLIGALAEKARIRLDNGSGAIGKNPITFPRPMLHSPDLHFSFSGLKTSVLYFIEKAKAAEKTASTTTASEALTSETMENIALAFEDAVTEVLITKTAKALDAREAHTLVVGGGVIANSHIRAALETLARERGIPILLPPPGISGDNAVMIALAGALSTATPITPEQIRTSPKALVAEGNLVL